MGSRAWLVWASLAVGVCACWGQTATPEEPCASCHEQAKKVIGTVHADVGCTSCHARHEEYPHPAGIPKPKCAQCHAEVSRNYERSVHGQAVKHGNSAAPECSTCHGDVHEMKNTSSAEFRKGIPETCGMCHSDISQQFSGSVHGKAVAQGNMSAPVCTTCHGEHNIQAPKNPASTVNARHIRETCGQCHGDVRLARKFNLPSDRLTSFDQSYHGLAARAGSSSVANCASCHGFHNILPSSDPHATTNQRNLPKTCGKCHPGAGTRFALGPVHVSEGRAESPAVSWIRWGYSILIPGIVGFMLLHNLGDWFRKLMQRRLGKAARAFRSVPLLYHASHRGKREIRMYPLERLQHGALVLSFTVLVWTGFALVYPTQWWAAPLVRWEAYWPVRGTVHRVAAVVFIVLSFAHLFALMFNRQLRTHWKTLWPKRSDVPEAIGGFAYNMGLLTRKPYISAHSYVEKMEYWAVVWGAVVMAGTGLLLWANNLALRYLPKSFTDIATAIHLYEAILATLAIVVWHFYFVIFDPDVYPMEMAWLNGYSVRERASEEAGQATEEDSESADEQPPERRE